MSIKTGNEKFKVGLYREAIEEYGKIGSAHPLYQQAGFNIKHAERMLRESPQGMALVRSPLLSVVMPVFNVGPFLDASILSVLHQTYKHIELIIVDDASTDGGGDILRMYEQLDSRVRVIRLPYNTLGGAGIPSNVGINAAKGEYIAFVDSDDFVSRDAFEALVREAERNRADLVIGDFNNFDQQSRELSPAYDAEHWEKIPTGEVISAHDLPDLYRLSPVPWRKLYRTQFLNKHAIRYPEGDYFFEDNPLHWAALAAAERVVMLNKVIAYHRMAREGQTMNSSAYKVAAICSHANTIGMSLSGKKQVSQLTIDEFYDYVFRQSWVVDKQVDASVKALIEKRFSNIYRKCVKGLPPKHLCADFRKKFENYKAAYPDLDLTIVIPAYNCADMIAQTIESLDKLKIPHNILVIDDGSTDDTVKVAKALAAKVNNLHVFEQGNRGAGRARNALVPLCTGQYTYFLDADDVIDSTVLEEAVGLARRGDNDLFLFGYKIEFFEDKKRRDMFDSDKKVFAEIKAAKDVDQRRTAASKLINYPWNRIIRTDLLHDENIFFGPTVVHNDIPFHWHSIASAKKIGFMEKDVCVHRKFSERAQITNINDARRMMVFEALRYTQERLVAYPSYKLMAQSWRDFATHLIGWAKDRVPQELEGAYKEQAAAFMNKLQGVELANGK
ncbi:MAG: glycosyltransferase [Azoarcus sp.]|nr:glycosyltransferase [Azoarcus sp.]